MGDMVEVWSRFGQVSSGDRELWCINVDFVNPVSEER
jgi:hypothetical protein